MTKIFIFCNGNLKLGLIGMSAPERILIETLAQIQLRVMVKWQSVLIKPDSVDQDKSGEIGKRTDNPIDINKDILLEKADGSLR